LIGKRSIVFCYYTITDPKLKGIIYIIQAAYNKVAFLLMLFLSDKSLCWIRNPEFKGRDCKSRPAGIRVKGKNAFSLQYHPVASPGPHDSRYLFDDFVEMMGEKAGKLEIVGKTGSRKDRKSVS